MIMKIKHQIINNWSSKEVKKLKEFNINIETGFYSFMIDENETYLQIKPFLLKWGVMDVSGSFFTKKEELESQYAQISPTWLNDYPQPEDDYLELCYNLTNYCSVCGIGAEQTNPLRIKKEPNWNGKKKLFSFNWIFDEIFVQKEWYLKIFKPLGLESMPVIIHKKNTVSNSVVQLVIPTSTSKLKLESHLKEVCSKCNQTKYLPIIKGFFPELKEDIDLPIFKSIEYCGSGASANKWIIINKDLKTKLINNKFNIVIYPFKSNRNF